MFWSLDNLRTLEFAEVEYDDANEAHDVDISSSLIYRSIIDEMYPIRVEESRTENVTMVDEAVYKMYVLRILNPTFHVVVMRLTTKLCFPHSFSSVLANGTVFRSQRMGPFLP